MAVYEEDDDGWSWSNGDLRLVGAQEFVSSDAVGGRLEVYFDWYYRRGLTEGEWGTICGLTFSMTEATVACHQLGYVTALSWDYAINTE